MALTATFVFAREGVVAIFWIQLLAAGKRVYSRGQLIPVQPLPGYPLQILLKRDVGFMV